MTKINNSTHQALSHYTVTWTAKQVLSPADEASALDDRAIALYSTKDFKGAIQLSAEAIETCPLLIKSYIVVEQCLTKSPSLARADDLRLCIQQIHAGTREIDGWLAQLEHKLTSCELPKKLRIAVHAECLNEVRDHRALVARIGALIGGNDDLVTHISRNPLNLIISRIFGPASTPNRAWTEWEKEMVGTDLSLIIQSLMELLTKSKLSSHDAVRRKASFLEDADPEKALKLILIEKLMDEPGLRFPEPNGVDDTWIEATARQLLEIILHSPVDDDANFRTVPFHEELISAEMNPNGTVMEVSHKKSTVSHEGW